MRTVEEIKALYADMPPRTRTWLQSIGSTSLSDCLALLDHIAELEAANAALQAQVGTWQGVDVVPTEDVERCFLRQTEHGYKSWCFGGFQVGYGWHYFAQYGDGSEYPQALDNSTGAWDWMLIPDESPTAAESEE